MTFDQWLEEVTGSFPAGVRTRLAQEYRAHWEESGGGDVVALFGPPTSVRLELLKRYTPQSLIAALDVHGGWLSVTLLPLAALAPAALQAPSEIKTIILAVTVSALAFLWTMTLRLDRPRRHAFRIVGCWMVTMILKIVALMLVVNPTVFDYLVGIPALLLLVPLLCISPLFNANLRRTLALEGASA